MKNLTPTAVLDEQASDEVNAIVADLVAQGATWIADPAVDGVWGLRLPGASALRVVAVVYTADLDFELDESVFHV